METKPTTPLSPELNVLPSAAQEDQQTLRNLSNELQVAKSHYCELLQYFKHLVSLTGGAVALIVAVAGGLLFSNLRDVASGCQRTSNTCGNY
jgi:hypothetical protein